jgi:hypothetical protein
MRKQNPTFTIGLCEECGYQSVYGPDRLEADGSRSTTLPPYCRRCGKKAIKHLNKFFYTYQDALEDIYGIFYISGARRQFGPVAEDGGPYVLKDLEDKDETIDNETRDRTD